jgi:hypothetical protein
MIPDEFHKEVTGSSSKVTKDAKLLMDIRKYVAKNINKILSIILEAWEISMDVGVMTGRICSLKEYLQKYL